MTDSIFDEVLKYVINSKINESMFELMPKIKYFDNSTPNFFT